MGGGSGSGSRSATYDTGIHQNDGNMIDQRHEEPKNPTASEEVLIGHPEDLESFWHARPEFIWGPLVFAALVRASTEIPQVAAYIKANGMVPYGFTSALEYTVFSVILSYAFHAFVIIHVTDNLKLQDDKPYNTKPRAMAARSTAAIMTELVYSVFPMSPATTSWIHFWVAVAVFAVFWDAWFYCAHRWAHTNKWAYRFFHKMHHLNKHSNCFGAYFVSYQSHILLEQIVVLIGCAAGLPRDVFNFYMYYGTLGTFIEHCGYELGTMKLPLLPVTFGQLSKALSFYAVGLLEGVNTAEHDWHHEKFTTNYSLSFKYLDKLFGTYHPGRLPGPSKERAK